jgi:hypothetical protein
VGERLPVRSGGDVAERVQAKLQLRFHRPKTTGPVETASTTIGLQRTEDGGRSSNVGELVAWPASRPGYRRYKPCRTFEIKLVLPGRLPFSS